MDKNDALQQLLEMDESDLEKVSFTLPSIVLAEPYRDADGFATPLGTQKEEMATTRTALQQDCWDKFNKNPQVNTSVRGVVGRITGMGFEATSEIIQIQSAIEEIELDWRNRLYNNWRSYVGRASVEGELFLIFTVHPDGFIEVDFLDPSLLPSGGDDDTGIIFHPKKSSLPILYLITDENDKKKLIPSIFVARDPNLLNDVKSHDDYDAPLLDESKDTHQAYESIGGFKQFIVAWDKGFATRRTVSYLRTTLEWLNAYEDLKKYEIDHKKSAGAYVWVFTFDDVKAFKLWANLTDDERAATALTQRISPGSRLFIPPGMKLEAKNPNLPNISNSDTDILQMVVSGLNESSDVTTGSVGGTFASVKATRGPMSDRTSDEVAYFDRFYKFDFWGSIFFLKHKVSDFPEFFEIEEVIAFKNGENVLGKKKYRAEQLVDTSYPISETIDLQDRVKAMLGSKHGPLPESIGIPPSEAAKRLGIGNYGRNRLRKATEDRKYPPLVYSIDSGGIESTQEKAEGEKPNVNDKKDKPKANQQTKK